MTKTIKLFITIIMVCLMIIQSTVPIAASESQNEVTILTEELGNVTRKYIVSKDGTKELLVEIHLEETCNSNEGMNKGELSPLTQRSSGWWIATCKRDVRYLFNFEQLDTLIFLVGFVLAMAHASIYGMTVAVYSYYKAGSLVNGFAREYFFIWSKDLNGIKRETMTETSWFRDSARKHFINNSKAYGWTYPELPYRCGSGWTTL